ncbi:hypothetical protein [Verrucomicrobium sp. BvORR034]|uniref:hypothetical protein n=1 Tax=Verrucomicrobium sp. BvORR034 TaxID=1396418 RepID=UPI002240F4A9|nr:hypothetical protein [Verrucomicrobium sp. BvORR034]
MLFLHAMPPKSLLSLVGCACVLASPLLPPAVAAEPSSQPAITPPPAAPPSADASGPRSTEMPLPGGGKVVLSAREHFGGFRGELIYHSPEGKTIRLWDNPPRYSGNYASPLPGHLITVNRVGDQVLALLEQEHSHHLLLAWKPGASTPTNVVIVSALLHQVTHARDRKITLKSARELELTYSSSQPPLLVTVSKEETHTLKASREPGGSAIDVTHLGLPLDGTKPALPSPGYDLKVSKYCRLNNGLIYIINAPTQPGEPEEPLVWLPDGGHPEVLQRGSSMDLLTTWQTPSVGFATDRQVALLRRDERGTLYYQSFTKTQEEWHQTACTPFATSPLYSTLLGIAVGSSSTYEPWETRFTGIRSFSRIKGNEHGGQPPDRFEVLDQASPAGEQVPLITSAGELIPHHLQNWGPIPLTVEQLRTSGINAYPYIDSLPLGTSEVRIVRAPKNGDTVARLILHPGSPRVVALTGKDDVLGQGPWRFLTGRSDHLSAEFVVIGPGGQPEYWRFAPSPSVRGWPLTDEAKLDDLNVAQLLQAKFTSERKLDCLWEDGSRARYEFPGRTDVGNTSPTLRTAVRSDL